MLRSIRARIVLWNALVLAVCLMLTGLVIHAGVKANLVAEADKEVYSMAQQGVASSNTTGQPDVVAQSVRRAASIDRVVHNVDRALLHLIPFALILSSAGGWALAAVGLNPIRRLAAAASEIDASDLGRRLPVQGKDEVAELTTAFNQLLERLHRSFEFQRRFVADASHELRTPLTALKANTSLALTGVPELEEYAISLRSADSAADRMARLVDELLFLSRADAGQARPRAPSEELVSVVRRSVEMFHTQTIESGVCLSTDLDCAYRSFCDGDLIERLLSNLIGNALRHTASGGSVIVRLRLTADKLQLSVSDTGHGIAPEHLSHLFERFYRVDTDRARSGGGAGLGLAICRSIADSLGGSIAVQSELGVGTCFEVLLPRSNQGLT